MLTVEFIITESCNLRCTYCYMNNNPTMMTKDKVDLFIVTVGEVLKIYKQDKYHISFFGGEPLLNWELIKYAVPKFKADPRLHSLMIISNGLELTEERVKYIKENGLGMSISFDGLWNDKNRPTASGKPSLQSYLDKKDIISSVANCSKCMVSPQNLDTLVENHIFFTQNYGFTSPDFSLVRDNIWSKEDLEKYDQEIVKLANHVIDRIKQGHFEFNGLFGLYILDLIYGKKFGKRSFGCFAGLNGVGYDPTGIYYPCARFSSEKHFPLYDANTKTFYKKNIDKFQSDKISNPKTFVECKECSLYNYCNAGCTHSQLVNGNMEQAKPIESVCSLFHMTYRESIRITKELKDNIIFKNILSNLSKGMG